MKRSSTGRHASGQILVIYAIVLPVLLVAMGIAVDFGFAYVARAGLSKAADAAALAAMRNINLGQATAIQVGQSAFNANYFPVPGNSAPTVNISFATDAASETLVNVTATSTYNTAPPAHHVADSRSFGLDESQRRSAGAALFGFELLKLLRQQHR